MDISISLSLSFLRSTEILASLSVSVNWHICLRSSGVFMATIWIWLPKASKLITKVTEEKALKRALGLIISLLIPYRDINVCKAFDRKAGCSLGAR